MNKHLFGTIIGIVGISAFVAGCGKSDDQNTNNANSSTTVTNDAYDINAVLANIVTNDTANDSVDLPENTNESLNTNTTNTNTAVKNTNSTVNTNTSLNTNTAPDAVSSITVTIPEQNAALTSPFMVEGTATGTQVFARVRSANGTAIFTEKISVNSGKFKGKLLFDFTTTRAGYLDVFQKDDSDQEINLVTVPVTFSTGTATNGNTNSVTP
jgi:hypothetical protein